MATLAQPLTPASFATFGDLLKYLRRRERLTQLELSIAVGYSEAQISRLEKNLRLPDLTALRALFIPALHLQDEPELAARLLELARSARQEDAPAPGVAPYKGLLYFDESDAEWFFGREVLTTHLAERVNALAANRTPRLLTVVGASGSGKSSVMRAGLAVVLKQSGWEVHTLTPTAQPLKTLETQSALAGGDTNHRRTIYVIDQFEELFTLCHDETARAAFIEKLLAGANQAGEQTTVLLALRADFYSHCAQYPALRQAIAAQQEYIGQMTVGELRRAVEEPARRGGWEFEAGLVDLILRDIGAEGAQDQEPGALPLLSHALLATWERRRGRTLTLDGYRAAGGVRGAIAETAESVFTDQLNEAQQRLARDVFLRLTELGEGTEDTRRRAALTELVPRAEVAAQMRAVLNTLADARLVSLGEATAEVAHEALIREWHRLREWLNEDREGLRLHRHITAAAREWELLRRDAGALYRGARLVQALEWGAENAAALNAQERAFLEASKEWAEREAAEHEAQRQRELEAAQELTKSSQRLFEEEQRHAEEQHLAARRLRRLVRYLAGAFLLALILAIIALFFGEQTRVNAEAAERNSRTAFARELAAASASNLNTDPERSILLALHGVGVTAPDKMVLPEVETALHRAIANSRIQKTFTAHQGEVAGMAYSPDGSRLVTIGSDNTLRVWDTATYRNLLTLSALDVGIESLARNVESIAFSSDSKRMATASEIGSPRIWDVSGGQPLFDLIGHTKPVRAIAFSPDGKQLATSSEDKTIKFWDAASGSELATWKDLHEPAVQLVYSPDGARLYFLEAPPDNVPEPGQLRVVDLQSGREIFRVEMGYYTFALSHDGRQLAVLPPDNSLIRLLDAATGRFLANVPRPPNRITWMVFSPDNSQLAVSALDRKVLVWDVARSAELFKFSGHAAKVNVVAFSPDGKHLASGGGDGTLKIWSLEEPAEVFSGGRGANRIAVSPDGSRIAATSSPRGAYDFKNITVWDAQNGSILFEHRVDDAFALAVAFSPDGRQVATAGGDRTIKLWDAAIGSLQQLIPIDDETIWSIAYHPDGHSFAIGGSTGIVRFFDPATGAPLEHWDAGLGALSAVAFSPDGSTLALVSHEKNEGKLAETAGGKELFNLHGLDATNWDVGFSSDASRVVTAGSDGTARIWDALTGKLLLTLTGHTSAVISARFSPDGTRIATGAKDGTSRLWDAATGKELLLLEGVFSPNDAEFTPDGKRLVWGGGGPVQVVALTIDELTEIARSRLTRTWTPEECNRFLHVSQCPPAQ